MNSERRVVPVCLNLLVSSECILFRISFCSDFEYDLAGLRSIAASSKGRFSLDELKDNFMRLAGVKRVSSLTVESSELLRLLKLLAKLVIGLINSEFRRLLLCGGFGGGFSVEISMMTTESKSLYYFSTGIILNVISLIDILIQLLLMCVLNFKLN